MISRFVGVKTDEAVFYYRKCSYVIKSLHNIDNSKVIHVR